MLKKRIALLVAACSVLCLILAACGGQGKPADATDALANPDGKPRETETSITESTEQMELTDQTEPTEFPYDSYLQAVIEAGSYVGSLESLRYYPFVYSEDDSFAFFGTKLLAPTTVKKAIFM